MITTITAPRGPALLLAAACGLMFLAHTPAAAEEQILRFKLVVRPLGHRPSCPRLGATKYRLTSTQA